jgi:hypothetical protein
MSALDWKNIDLSALAKSQVAVGSAVVVLSSVAAIVGYSLTPDDQAQLTTLITSALTLIGGTYAFWKRITAQPEHQTVIVPKKDSTPPQS